MNHEAKAREIRERIGAIEGAMVCPEQVEDVIAQALRDAEAEHTKEVAWLLRMMRDRPIEVLRDIARTYPDGAVVEQAETDTRARCERAARYMLGHPRNLLNKNADGWIEDAVTHAMQGASDESTPAEGGE